MMPRNKFILIIYFKRICCYGGQLARNPNGSLSHHSQTLILIQWKRLHCKQQSIKSAT